MRLALQPEKAAVVDIGSNSVRLVIYEVTGAAELVTGKNQEIPVTLVRGFRYEESAEGSKTLIRDASLDMFR